MVILVNRDFVESSKIEYDKLYVLVLLQKAKVQFDTLALFSFNLKQWKIVQRRRPKMGGGGSSNVSGGHNLPLWVE